MDTTEVRLRDGTTTLTPMDGSYHMFAASSSSDVVTPPIAGVRWLGRSSRFGSVGSIVPKLTETQRRALATGVASVTMTGHVQVWIASAAETLPLVVGTELTSHGRRTRIVEWRPDDAESTMVVDASMIDTSRRSSPAPMLSVDDALVFVLVNEARHEAAVLRHHEGSGSIDGLVLPGTPLRSSRGQLGLRLGPNPNVAIPDSAWLSGARLRHVTTTYRGSYPIRLVLRPVGAMPPTP
jgi:hypothetical protein